MVTENNREKSLKRILLLGGCGRCGTSILGNLVASLRDVEYYYDPGFVHNIMFKAEIFGKALFRELLSVYLYDECLLNSIAGRTLNFNKKDGTFIRNFKNETEINIRLSKAWRRSELEILALKKTIAVKVTDSVFCFSILKEYLPELRGVFIFRNASDVLDSLVEKGWFTNESLQVNAPTSLIPYDVFDNVRVPKWVDKEDREFWIRSNEYDRCAYYYCKSNENIFEAKKCGALILSYESLLEDANIRIEEICAYTGLKNGEMTSKIVASVKRQRKSLGKSMNLISESSKEQILDLEYRLLNI